MTYSVEWKHTKYELAGGSETKRVPIDDHSDGKGNSCQGRIGLLQLDVKTSQVSGGKEIGDFQIIMPQETFTNYLVICEMCRTKVG